MNIRLPVTLVVPEKFPLLRDQITQDIEKVGRDLRGVPEFRLDEFRDNVVRALDGLEEIIRISKVYVTDDRVFYWRTTDPDLFEAVFGNYLTYKKGKHYHIRLEPHSIQVVLHYLRARL